MRPGAVESGQAPLQQRIFMISVLLSRREAANTELRSCGTEKMGKIYLVEFLTRVSLQCRLPKDHIVTRTAFFSASFCDEIVRREHQGSKVKVLCRLDQRFKRAVDALMPNGGFNIVFKAKLKILGNFFSLNRRPDEHARYALPSLSRRRQLAPDFVRLFNQKRPFNKHDKRFIYHVRPKEAIRNLVSIVVLNPAFPSKFWVLGSFM
ncbi:hypothetical protein LDFHOB_01445 [Candidatus Electronema aureum]